MRYITIAKMPIEKKLILNDEAEKEQSQHSESDLSVSQGLVADANVQDDLKESEIYSGESESSEEFNQSSSSSSSSSSSESSSEEEAYESFEEEIMDAKEDVDALTLESTEEFNDTHFYKNDLIQLSLDDIKSKHYESVGEDGDVLKHNVMYQATSAKTLEDAAEFLTRLHIYRDVAHTPMNQRQLEKISLSHIVVEVPDDYDPSQPLGDVASRIFVLQPDGYLHQALNNDLAEIEAELEKLETRLGEAPSREKYLSISENLKDAIDRKAELEAELDRRLTSPFIEFEGPKFVPELVRQDAAVSRDGFFAFVACESMAHQGLRGFYDNFNDNNSNDDIEQLPTSSPVLSRHSGMFTPKSSSGAEFDLTEAEREWILRDSLTDVNSEEERKDTFKHS